MPAIHATNLILLGSLGLMVSAAVGNSLRASEPVRLVIEAERLGERRIIPSELTDHHPAAVQAATASTASGPECFCPQHTGCPVCVPEVTTQNRKKTLYRCQEKTICLARCGWILFGGCPEECLECEPPRTVRLLMKKVVDQPQPTVRCVPKPAK